MPRPYHRPPDTSVPPSHGGPTTVPRPVQSRELPNNEWKRKLLNVTAIFFVLHFINVRGAVQQSLNSVLMAGALAGATELLTRLEPVREAMEDVEDLEASAAADWYGTQMLLSDLPARERAETALFSTGPDLYLREDFGRRRMDP